MITILLSFRFATITNCLPLFCVLNLTNYKIKFKQEFMFSVFLFLGFLFNQLTNLAYKFLLRNLSSEDLIKFEVLRCSYLNTRFFLFWSIKQSF